MVFFFSTAPPIRRRAARRVFSDLEVSPVSKNKKMLILKIFYIALVVISALIVIGYCIVTFAVRPPSVDEPNNPPSFGPNESQSPNQPNVEDPNGSEPPVSTGPVMTRRTEVYTCLIFGVDAVSGSTDTIMVATFDVPNKQIGLVSIPRDTVVRQDLTAPFNKINAAYAKDGVAQLDKELEELLGFPVDFYVKIKLSAFEKLVNAVGGVWFDVPINMDYDDPTQDLHIHLSKGYQLLDGEQAMGLVRYRQDNAGNDTFGDTGRAGVQQAFLKAMLSQVISGAGLGDIPALVDVLLNYVETDAGLNDMLYFGKSLVGVDIGAAVTTATLPAQWHSPYMWVEEEKALELINQLLNPYDSDITADMVEFFKR